MAIGESTPRRVPKRYVLLSIIIIIVAVILVSMTYSVPAKNSLQDGLREIRRDLSLIKESWYTDNEKLTELVHGEIQKDMALLNGMSDEASRVGVSPNAIQTLSSKLAELDGSIGRREDVGLVHEQASNLIKIVDDIEDEIAA
ncbi:MAG: hypothetical protein CMO12_02295 [Thaumarchaeota archaeon]|nr:hypothetical protein [Nitrososphaerota archaeon]